MSLCKIRSAFFTMVMSGCAFAAAGCAKNTSHSAQDRSIAAASPVIQSMPTGNWIELKCNEGELGPDFPPPTYNHGVIRFIEGEMTWGSQAFDDKQCTARRPTTVAETHVRYQIAANAVTTDGSIPVDAQVPSAEDDGTSTVMYGLIKVQNGLLYIGLFSTAATRPQTLEEKDAQVFASF